MKPVGIFLAILGLGATVQAECLPETSRSSALKFLSPGIGRAEELQLDEILVKLYGGNIKEAELAKKSLYQGLLNKSKIDMSKSHAGGDCIDIFE